MTMSEPVYANIIPDGTQDKDRRNKRNQTPQHTGSDSVKNSRSRAAAVCLVLLCVLLLTAVIVLCVNIHTNNTNNTQKRDELLTNINSLTEERDQLLTSITNLTEDKDELQTKINGLTEDRDHLVTNITNLTEERDELIIKNIYLLNETQQLINQLQLLCKEDEWIYYQSSFYYMSSEMKNWTESRQDCLKRRADLIIINNRDEQDFVKNISDKREFWIGVTDSDVEGRWKWVDGSTLTSGFWASREPNGGKVENCAVTYLTKWPDLLGWLDVRCNNAYQWICEKSIWP
ncbi:CD209 antigen-like protein C isoform X2 [Onychostoma macrolepis]|uniref:CD209 antigen-like protein C isoform X2 n=1 Tax=Onychostoma macrolepis TaxID=369639 RepID=UPI002729DF1F|nr:CD209 antigen-like protein C isoform X2 [Onychostoma macrolepis]